MPLTLNAEDNGLGWFATCDCSDFTYRQEKLREMTQEQINSREKKGFEVLRVDHRRLVSFLSPGVVYEVLVIGGSEPHTVNVSKGKGERGPNFLCAHSFCALKYVLKIHDKFDVVAFGRKDTQDPVMMKAAGWERRSLDGWMDVIVRRFF